MFYLGRVPNDCKLEYISRKLKTEGWKEGLFVAILELPSDRPIDLPYDLPFSVLFFTSIQYIIYYICTRLHIQNTILLYTASSNHDTPVTCTGNGL